MAVFFLKTQTHSLTHAYTVHIRCPSGNKGLVNRLLPLYRNVNCCFLKDCLKRKCGSQSMSLFCQQADYWWCVCAACYKAWSGTSDCCNGNGNKRVCDSQGLRSQECKPINVGIRFPTNIQWTSLIQSHDRGVTGVIIHSKGKLSVIPGEALKESTNTKTATLPGRRKMACK